MNMYKIIKSLVCVFALLALSQGFNSIAHAAEKKATNAHYKFTDGVNRTWIAPEFWAKPLESWRLNSGRMEVALPVGNAMVYSLTHQMNALEANFEMSVTIGTQNAKSKIGSAGFRLCAKSSLGDYRSPVVRECGVFAGFANNGGLFIGNAKSAKPNTQIANADSLVLTVKGYLEDARYVLSLIAKETSGRELGHLKTPFDAKILEGNLGVISHPEPTSYMKLGKKTTQHWFDDWKISGAAEHHRLDRGRRRRAMEA